VYRYLQRKNIAQAQKGPSNWGFWFLCAGAQGCFGHGTEVFARATKGLRRQCASRIVQINPP
jgi:hypothetical protein